MLLQDFLKPYRPRISYQPFLTSVPGMIGAVGDLGIQCPRNSVESVKNYIRQRSLSLSGKDREVQINMNIGAALGFDEFCSEHVGQARTQAFGSLNLLGSISVEFTLDVILEIDGRRTILFIDPRSSSKKIDGHGKRFAFSCMHERTRMLDPLSFGDFSLAILQFGPTNGLAKRQAQLHWDDGIELFSMNELIEMTQATYQQLEELRVASTQNAQQATGTGGFI